MNEIDFVSFWKDFNSQGFKLELRDRHIQTKPDIFKKDNRYWFTTEKSSILIVPFDVFLHLINNLSKTTPPYCIPFKVNN